MIQLSWMLNSEVIGDTIHLGPMALVGWLIWRCGNINCPVRIIHIWRIRNSTPAPPKPQNTWPTLNFQDPEFKYIIYPISLIRRFHYSLIHHLPSHLGLAFAPPTRMNVPTAILRFARTQYRHEPHQGLMTGEWKWLMKRGQRKQEKAQPYQ